MPYKNIEDRREASRRHYEKNKLAMIARTKAANRVARVKNRQYLDEAKSVPCCDCGETYPPYVMQFDHVQGEKKFDLGMALSNRVSLKKIQEEINKCEVVCANCHAERTHRRLQS